MSAPDRNAALQQIEENIRTSGFHIYMIKAATTPRYAYTIGLRNTLGAELVLAGAVHYMASDILAIIHAIRANLIDKRSFESLFHVVGLGSFILRRVHHSWARLMMTGAMHYYGTDDVDAIQIRPEESRMTIDVPDMTTEWSASQEPVWRYLAEPWAYPVPRESTATTNLEALRGEVITEVVRWSEDEWEMFAGNGEDVTDEMIRVVPLGTLLAKDASLSPALSLDVGKGMWRDRDDGKWHPWSSAGPESE